MIQLPEICDEKSEASKACYKTICDIGEARIRLAGKNILDNLSVGVRGGAAPGGTHIQTWDSACSA